MSATNLPVRAGDNPKWCVDLCVNIAAIVVVLCFFVCSALPALSAETASNASAAPAAKSKEQLRAIYMNALKAEGYVPEVDKKGDIQFKKEGRTYAVKTYEGTPFYVEIYTAFGFEIGGDADLQKAYKKMTEVAAQIRAVKVFLSGDKKILVFSTEFYLKNPQDFHDLFPTYLSALASDIGKLTAKE